MRRVLYGLLLLALVGCGSAAQDTSEPASGNSVQAVTTMNILADLISHVGGERVSVKNIIPTGAGPEDYQPTPGDAQAIANAQIIFYNGHGLEDWLLPLFANAAPSQPKIELSAGLPSIDGAEGNPHFWLDPTYAISYTQTIRDELSTLDPAGAATYAANAAAYIEELQQLDVELQAAAASIPAERRVLITNHDAFPYFARHYGFEVLGVILENPEAELSAGELNQLIETIKAHNVSAIFAEAQFNQRTTQLLADEAGVKTIAVLYTDSLDATVSTYAAMMRYNMRTIVQALKE